MEPPRDRGRRDRRAAHLAGRRHARVGLGRLDRRRREGLHPRQRHRGRPPLGRRGRERGRRRRPTPTATPIVDEDDAGDVCGHGTACAGIIRSLAPDAELHSVRVLGAANTGSGSALLAGLRYAIEQRFDVINMSLSTTKKQFAAVLHELADEAYFGRTTLVASAHNMSVESYPWRFSSVISVGSHEDPDPLVYYANPSPPVEFFAKGVDVEVAWSGDQIATCTGNSFATPHISGVCALIRGAHPELTPFELKTVLRLTATNVRSAP